MAGTPLRWNMILPNGEPLRMNTPGARWNGTVEEVMAAIAQQNQTMNTPYNQISQTITDQMVTDILGKIGELETSLAFCISLTDEQHGSMLKLGNANVSFVNKSVGYMGTNPEYISMLYPAVEVNKDFTGANQMDKILPRLQLLVRKALDTRMQMGSEAVHGCLAYMNNAGEAAYRGQAAAEPIYKDLSAAYPGPGTKAQKVSAAKAKTANP